MSLQLWKISKSVLPAALENVKQPFDMKTIQNLQNRIGKVIHMIELLYFVSVHQSHDIDRTKRNFRSL